MQSLYALEKMIEYKQADRLREAEQARLVKTAKAKKPRPNQINLSQNGKALFKRVLTKVFPTAHQNRTVKQKAHANC